MLELLRNLTDDQTAIVGCVAAMLGAVMLLAVSFHANPQNRETSNETVRGTQQQKPSKTASQEERRAA